MLVKENSAYRILIVDDVTENIKVLGNILRSESFQIGFASNGARALEVLLSGEYDLVLLDIMMPGINGFETLERMRKIEKLSDIPVIFLTAKVEKESIVHGLTLGAQDYISKPFNAGEMLSRVRTHLELADARKELLQLNENLEQKVAKRTEQLKEANDELLTANQKLSTLEKAKNDFLALISHEVRTPLNGIMGFGQMLQYSLTDPEHLEYIDYLNQSADRLMKFSDTALLITQLSVDKYPLNSEDHSLEDIVNQVIEQYQDDMGQKKIRVEMKIDANAGHIHCDRELIRKAIGEVIHNAIKFSPDNEVIRINSTLNDNNVELHIIDNGEGFSDEAREGVFGIFSTTDVMKHSDGHGLGLAAVKMIMEAHQGMVDLANNKNGGARVTLRIGK